MCAWMDVCVRVDGRMGFQVCVDDVCVRICRYIECGSSPSKKPIV